MRERIIETATELFAHNGYHAVGIARIVEEAKVSRVALYNNFASKEELILVVLRRRDEAVRNVIMREACKGAAGPRDRLLKLFDFLGAWSEQTDFTGCMFLNAVAEYHALDDPIHRVAVEHKRLMLSYIEKQCREGGAADPSMLAHQLYVLFDGAIVQAHATGEADPRVAAARAAATALIDQAGVRNKARTDA
ncbi:MAG: helix-turn-helix domain-containing protein [Pseudomonadota bacterium]